MGKSTISRSERRSSENRVQSWSFGLSVRICDSSKARITKGHRDPVFESNTDSGSMNLQRVSPAVLTSPNFLFMYWGGLFACDAGTILPLFVH